VRDFISRLFEPLLRLLLPPSGRHRPDAPGLAARQSRERQERVRLRLCRERRRALWLATYGIDVGPRVIHGMAVR
jgi:hypothetical protein